jgi:hypothetical protein
MNQDQKVFHTNLVLNISFYVNIDQVSRSEGVQEIDVAQADQSDRYIIQ